MRRSKVLVKSACITVAITGLTYSVFKFTSTPGVKVVEAAELPKKPAINPKVLQEYKAKQNELKVAIETYFENALAKGDIIGAGVSIVKGDSIVISEGFGKRNANLKEPVDSETIFRLGSISKGFAGILAASFENEGLIHWEDKVSDYIPEFRLGDKSNTDKITLANLLSHTAGTPYHSFTNLVEAGLPLSDIVDRFKDITPVSAPGAMYSYQNAMFALCGEVIRRETGQDLASALMNRFFKPLNMHSTCMDHETLTHANNVAFPHIKRTHGWKPIKLTNKYYNAIAAGGINASALDMAKWMRFLLGHNPEVMDKSALFDAFKPFIEIGGHSKYYQRWPGHLKSYYGFGWRIHKYSDGDTKKEKTILHHGGSVNDFRNEIALFPEDDLGICVLLNSHSKIASNVIPELKEIVKQVYQQHTSDHSKDMASL
ncbi:serine hydrolase domain-containing protein [Aestuariibaculum suncheonense]|uniref:Beta-lactamase family protein n=1 Tax=Aestuariibaculum suncheonense TaxID=1028745 RepID=A0A8J6Q7T7_9FLAO|nr:serine hydrolase domain-containing protein [Aestuariibaculum suncheonense]MBD0835789.1 beta-lactamase family protein [Aestuariibaculum suncheonense]